MLIRPKDFAMAMCSSKRMMVDTGRSEPILPIKSPLMVG